MPSRSEHQGQARDPHVGASGGTGVRTRTRNAASPGALATARWRERQAQRSFVVRVLLFEHEVEVLVQFGLLQREQAHDRGWIGYAVEQLVERVVLRRTGTAR